MALYNGANREVAILCNHQRTVSSAQKEGLEKMQGRLEMLKRQKKVCPGSVLSVWAYLDTSGGVRNSVIDWV